MATRRVWIDDIGEVLLAKRRGTSGLRLSVNANGRVRVSLPHWLPYKTAEHFAKTRKDWIIKHKLKNPKPVLFNGARIGKCHILIIGPSPTPGLKAKINDFKIQISTSYGENSDIVQAKATITCEKALLKEARHYFPPKLRLLSQQHGFKYSELRLRKMTSRWGSCSRDKVITLSTYLVQLPWELIDYVMLHELAHTRHLNHGEDFWQTMSELVLDLKQKRKFIKEHRPRLEPR